MNKKDSITLEMLIEKLKNLNSKDSFYILAGLHDSDIFEIIQIVNNLNDNGIVHIIEKAREVALAREENLKKKGGVH